MSHGHSKAREVSMKRSCSLWALVPAALPLARCLVAFLFQLQWLALSRRPLAGARPKPNRSEAVHSMAPSF